jgi:PAS domain S-box-containing protein
MAAPIPARKEKIRVLLLEDSGKDATLVVHALKSANFNIESEVVALSTDFKERAQTGSYDIILADYNLPDWTGLEAILWLQKSKVPTPLILVTASLGEEQAVECVKEGATDYVLKSNLHRLPAVVNRALEEAKVRAERDQAEQYIQEAAEQYRLLFENNPNPMWVYDVETLGFLAVNNAAIRTYGFSREEFLSMTIKGIRPASELAKFMAEYEEWDKTSDVDVGVWRHQTKGGTAMDMEISSRRIRFGGRNARLVLALNITARLHAENELRKSEQRFATMVQSSPDGITVSTLNGRYVEVNEAYLRMVEYERSEVIGRTALELGVWAKPEHRLILLKQLETRNRIVGFETDFRTKSGTLKHVQISAELIQFQEAECVLGIVRDLTEQLLLQQQFRQAQKMEAVGRLAAGVAHDFNNLLMIIGSSAELLQQSKNDTSKIDRYTADIRKATDRAAGLTRQLLAFSRKQPLQLATIDLNAVVEDLWKMLPRLLGEDIEMVKGLAPKLAKVNVDRGQIEQVIMNLVINARDAMPKGGKLVIETNNVDLDSSYAKQHGIALTPGKYVMLAITDTGVGIDAETRTRIFEPFFTTKEQGKGTGLGLATVYGIIKQSEGFIWVYSEVERGTTFKIYLPRVAAPVSAEAAEVVAAVQGGNETILLVEDEGTLLKVASEYLQSKGYRVLEAGTGTEAVKLCQDYSGKIDLLVTDMVMPGMGGPEVAKVAMKMRPGLKVIYVSGYTDRAVDKESLGPDAAFLQKPFSLDALARRIRELVSK